MREIASAEIDCALADLGAAANGDAAASIHSMRKRCKRVRALLRLVRPAMERTYGVANVALRDAGRELSEVRDSQALVEAFDRLCESQGGEIRCRESDLIRAELRRHARAALSDPSLERHLSQAGGLLRADALDVEGWAISSDARVLAMGAARTYRRARNRLDDARSLPSNECLHQWRKRTKYLWIQMQLIEAAAPAILGPYAERLHTLSDLLGDDHDLAVLSSRLHRRTRAIGGPKTLLAVMPLIERSRLEHQQRAIDLGQALYADSPAVFSGRLSDHLRAGLHPAVALT